MYSKLGNHQLIKSKLKYLVKQNCVVLWSDLVNKYSLNEGEVILQWENSYCIFILVVHFVNVCLCVYASLQLNSILLK